MLETPTLNTNDIILTTASHVDGYKSIKTIEIVTAECVLGMNIFRDFFAGITDAIGGRSKATQNILRDAKNTCLNELRNEAKLLGGNAVIGVDLDYSEFSGQGKSMLFLVASGTAVLIKPESGFYFDTTRLQPTLENSEYKFYLIEKYGIKKHSLLNEYITLGKFFPTLEAAFIATHAEEVTALESTKRQRQEWLGAQTQQSPVDSKSAEFTEEEIDQMMTFGVKFDGVKFIFEKYKYDRLVDALNYARKSSNQTR